MAQPAAMGNGEAELGFFMERKLLAGPTASSRTQHQCETGQIAEYQHQKRERIQGEQAASS